MEEQKWGIAENLHPSQAYQDVRPWIQNISSLREKSGLIWTKNNKKGQQSRGLGQMVDRYAALEIFETSIDSIIYPFMRIPANAMKSAFVLLVLLEQSILKIVKI